MNTNILGYFVSSLCVCALADNAGSEAVVPGETTPLQSSVCDILLSVATLQGEPHSKSLYNTLVPGTAL